MFNAFNALSEDNSLLQLPPWSNPWLMVATCISLGLHCVILYIPFLAQVGVGQGGGARRALQGFIGKGGEAGHPWLIVATCISLGLHCVILYIPFLAQVGVGPDCAGGGGAARGPQEGGV